MEDNPDQGAGAQKQHSQPDGRESEERQSVQGYIAIKGTRNGLLLSLEPNTSFSELLQALAERLAEAPAFFRGASLSVDTSRRSLRISERIQLEDLLAHYQMSMSASESANVHKEVKTITLSSADISSTDDTTSTSEPIRHDSRESAETLFLRRTVRSGQAIQHHSNVVIMGDVNPGAEIIAGGDVIVWGVLRGMVHAGYPDNEQALVCSLQLAPVQLRIAHLLSRPPEGFEAQPRPEIAMIRQGRIVVEAWTNGRVLRR
ncbi:MAG: septum site-determining protein MinC [Chloroflexi bacterium]|nr:septum site-determining protein MinC [Ktedonobacteraceae bacterium]MBV9020582.1 septum site-determining protein MinC [Ktedonobacteraceae bacterium]MBV9708247.1 septum site-determining protein MinC [Chloroflexota bacterium]